MGSSGSATPAATLSRTATHNFIATINIITLALEASDCFRTDPRISVFEEETMLIDSVIPDTRLIDSSVVVATRFTESNMVLIVDSGSPKPSVIGVARSYSHLAESAYFADSDTLLSQGGPGSCGELASEDFESEIIWTKQIVSDGAWSDVFCDGSSLSARTWFVATASYDTLQHVADSERCVSLGPQGTRFVISGSLVQSGQPGGFEATPTFPKMGVDFAASTIGERPKPGLNLLLIGVIVGCAVVAFVVGLVVYLVCRHRANGEEDESSTMDVLGGLAGETVTEQFTQSQSHDMSSQTVDSWGNSLEPSTSCES